MVQMRPDNYSSETVKGEKLVFNFLKALPDTESWIGLHSLDIFGDIPHGQGEADFVVLIPGKGVLVIEVKTHSNIECKDGVWRLNGKIPDKAPHKQASNAMHAIRTELQNAGLDLYKIPFGFCVWFTGSSKVKIPPSTEYKDWMFLFADDLNSDGQKRLSQLMDSWADHRKVPRGTPQNPVATSSEIKTVANRLRPDIKISKSADQRIKELEASLAAALQQQLELMHFISGKQMTAIIPGIAGTGKTHIAIAEAKKAHMRGDRTLFICFNSILGKFLKTELEGYSLVEVHTISEYMLEVSKLTYADAKDSEWWKTELPKQAQEALIGMDSYDGFDVLIVDEAQDIGLAPYLDVLDLSLTKGFAKSAVMLFGDFTHQALYIPGEMALSNIKSKIPNAIEFQLLDINCRNTKAIGDTVMQILKEKDTYSSYRRHDEGVVPKLISLKDGESPLKHLKEQLARLSKSFKLEHIVLLSSNKASLEHLSSDLGIPTTTLDFPQAGKLRWGTSQAFKGMEAPAVVLVEFEDGSIANRETFYVAGTRAISELVCIMPQSIVSKIRG